MEIKPMVYLSSPFSKGDKVLNIKNNMIRFYYLSKSYPFVDFYSPLANAAAGMMFKEQLMEEEFWIEYDLQMVKRCAIVYMFSSSSHKIKYNQSYEKSAGCKIEKEFAQKNNIPVVYTMMDLGKVLEVFQSKIVLS